MELVSVSIRKIMSTPLELMIDFNSCSLITRPRLMFQLQKMIFFLLVLFVWFVWFGCIGLSIESESIDLGLPTGVEFGSLVG